MGKDVKINVDADLFARVASCASADPYRYYLNGVHVEPAAIGGVLMVATDGLTLVAINDPSGSIEGGTAIVSADKRALAECRRTGQVTGKNGKRAPQKRRLLISGGKLSVVGTPEGGALFLDFSVCQDPNKTVIWFQWRDVLIDVTFPEWRNVLPYGAPDFSRQTGAYNPDKIKRVADALRDDKGTGASVAISAASEDAPAYLVVPESSISGFGLVMGMRRDRSPILPAWAPVRVIEKKAA